MLVTHRRPDGRYDRFTAEAPAGQRQLDTARADLAIGAAPSASVTASTAWCPRRGDRGPCGSTSTVRPQPNRYFPPVELREDDFVSGYVVPGLSATGAGRICVGGALCRVADARAYHDHNWGVWRDVTWEWGAARGASLSLLYGGVYGPARGQPGAGAVTSPFILGLVALFGVRQVLQFDHLAYEGAMAAEGVPGRRRPHGSRWSPRGARTACGSPLRSSTRSRPTWARRPSGACSSRCVAASGCGDGWRARRSATLARASSRLIAPDKTRRRKGERTKGARGQVKRGVRAGSVIPSEARDLLREPRPRVSRSLASLGMKSVVSPFRPFLLFRPLGSTIPTSRTPPPSRTGRLRWSS